MMGNISKSKGFKGDPGQLGPRGPQGERGIQGEKGRAPVKGVDYFTDADKAELVNAVLAALPNGDEVSY